MLEGLPVAQGLKINLAMQGMQVDPGQGTNILQAVEQAKPEPQQKTPNGLNKDLMCCS